MLMYIHHETFAHPITITRRNIELVMQSTGCFSAHYFAARYGFAEVSKKVTKKGNHTKRLSGSHE